MTEQEIARRLAYIHHTLELIALLIAVLVASQGGVSLVVGAGMIVLLIMNVLARWLAGMNQEPITD